ATLPPGGASRRETDRVSTFTSLAACRREQSSSPPSRSPKECVLHGRGRGDLLLFHHWQKRNAGAGRMTWKQASSPYYAPDKVWKRLRLKAKQTKPHSPAAA